ncbi:cold-shock protein [Bradyrhizobium sp. Cp5.3]|uniref:cold-shock protein n=1 Tax=Bradyrhizobium sp. Cp5.3 TaxID=443598 RepID=UPI0009FEB8DE|nr:cold shock domain-containing protein [Bradyrhizobium sp. Cp5.3]
MGKVIYGNRDRHYGFIRCDDGGDDQFVHVSALIDTGTLYVGDVVLFEVTRDSRGRREHAANVKLSWKSDCEGRKS